MKKILNITFSLFAASTIAHSQPIIVGNGPASSVVTISVTIPAMAKIMSVTRIAPITITRADIKNGSKVIPAAAALTIWSNASNGFVLNSRLVSLKAGDGSDVSGIMVLGSIAGTDDQQPQCAEFQALYQGAKAKKNLTGITLDLTLLINPGLTPGLYQLQPEFSVSCPGTERQPGMNDVALLR